MQAAPEGGGRSFTVAVRTGRPARRLATRPRGMNAAARNADGPDNEDRQQGSQKNGVRRGGLAVLGWRGRKRGSYPANVGHGGTDATTADSGVNAVRDCASAATRRAW